VSVFKKIKRRLGARRRTNNILKCSGSFVDYSKASSIARRRGTEYQTSQPFPHIALDEFLPQGAFDLLMRALPDPGSQRSFQDFSAKMGNGKTAQAGKFHLSNIRMMTPALRQFFYELNSAPFLAFLEQLTGIQGILPDPKLQGGGIHITKRGGLLRIHADFNKHRHYNLDRRLNLLLYCNPDWREEYGGHLELWSRDMARCEQRILPIANRCVLFSTTSDSYHGHPDPVTCPEDRARKSIALYYYTVGRPEEETNPAHETLWQERPVEQTAAKVA
jgi:hypothetical protein